MLKKIVFAGLIIIGFLVLPGNFLLYAEERFSSLQFDYASEMPGLPPIQSSCFIKGIKMRIEITMAGQNSVFISDGQKAYTCLSSQNLAIVIPISQVSGQLPVPKDYKNILGLKNIGQEEINGRLCDVYEYSQEGRQHKMWVAKDIDFPIKAESMTDKGKIITYISNVRKNAPLDDSLFQPPPGAQIIDAGGLLKGMGKYSK